MKKLFALALVLVILAAPALADFEDRSLAQLQDAAARLQAEILRRSGEPFTVQPGLYLVGRDLPAGTWRVELAGAAAEVVVYRSMEAASADIAIPMQDYLLGTFAGMAREVGALYLADGFAVRLDGPVTFSPFLGVQP